MENIGRDVRVRIVKGLDALLLTVPFFLCWYGYYATRTFSPFFRKGNYLVVLLFLFVYIIYGRMYDGFRISLNRVPDIVCSQGLAAFMTNCVMYVVIWLLMKHLPNPLPLLAAFAMEIVLAGIWALSAHKWYFLTHPPMAATVIYDQRSGLEKLVEEYGLEKKFCIRQTARVEECLQKIGMLDKNDAVFLSGIHSHERNIILKYCVEHRIEVFVIPRIGDVLMSGAKHLHMFHLPMLQTGRYHPSVEYLFAKRMIDILVSGMALLLLSPIMLVTAAAIHLTDKGPVFYRQCRLTKDGKKFKVLKFRSMRVDAEKDGIARLSSGENDSRVTSVGRFIRKVRIDELPQLINILKGDISLIGPRALLPDELRDYGDRSLILTVKSGLTGFAQVSGRRDISFEERRALDIYYVRNWSISLDAQIFVKTIIEVLKRDGAK